MKSIEEIHRKIDAICHENAIRPAAFWKLEANLDEKRAFTLWNRELRAYLIGGIAALEYRETYDAHEADAVELANIREWLSSDS